MIDHAIATRSLVMLISITFVTNSWAEDPSKLSGKHKQASADWKQQGWPLLKTFCIECHNEDTREGEVDLSLLRDLSPGDSGSAAMSEMQRVLEMVRFGAMPPDDADLPTSDQRKQLVTALDKALFSVACDLRPRPGKVTARRLNRAEYNNTIRDLFQMDLRPADAFPSDEVGAGFDNNGDVLSLSPTLIEKYLDAADFVSRKVLIDPETLPRTSADIPPDQLRVHGDTKTGRFNGRFLSKDAFAWFDVEVHLDGEYRIDIRGGNSNDGRPKTDVGVFNENGLLIGTEDMRYYGGSGRSRDFYFKTDLTKGKHRFYLEPIEDEDRELKVGKTKSGWFANVDPKIIKAGDDRTKVNLKPDDDLRGSQYPFMFRSARVSGPTRLPNDLFPPSQYKILRRQARRKDDRWEGVEDAAMECLKPLMRSAFRRPVDEEEVKPYAQLAVQACDRGESFVRAMQIAVSGVLVSPNFLFRIETPDEDQGNEGQIDSDDEAIALTPYQLATRMSYFLWSSTPDEQLMREAERGHLSGEKIRWAVERMLRDEKSESLATQFASQWFGLGNLQTHEADTLETFKDFDPKLLPAMTRETQLLFSNFVKENRPVADLLTADFTFLNSDLARHYGIDHQSDDFQRVSLKGTPRRGLLSQGSMLTLTSFATRTSPVLRGKWILENVLGTPPPDPPANVPDLEETKTAGKNASLREQLEIHRESSTCASCHRVMDQLGFGLEQFDAIGRYRTKDGKLAVDASGVLPGGRKFNGAAELSEVLGTTEREAFARTAVERLMTFAIGRELRPSDRCVVDEIVAATKKKDHRIADLIVAIVQSRTFRFTDRPDAK